MAQGVFQNQVDFLDTNPQWLRESFVGIIEKENYVYAYASFIEWKKPIKMRFLSRFLEK